MSQEERPFTAKNGTEHYEADGLIWQRRATGRQVRLVGEGEHGTARVRATWDVAPNSVEVPPGTVRVSRARSSNRGVTSSVMRDAERVLIRLTGAMPAQVVGLSEEDPQDEIKELARRLPPGPRGYPTYYAHLLKVFRLIEATGTRSTVKELARVTGKPEGTIKLHLRQARSPSNPQ